MSRQLFYLLLAFVVGFALLLHHFRAQRHWTYSEESKVVQIQRLDASGAPVGSVVGPLFGR